ncbi:HAD family hydrolase [Mucilaginibacter psychrotolerans]|uniref:HAD family hydrolase n=1 Tax=Mucilaginibacter psychrotolerans TaxID=1524096 RepID=A0A4Y8SFR8_9SPHI|nr:HAD family hydrolase [Mucilaginibacter psychrotolerans]TFF37294.1 HAD family hydrolase [Mucilaginibacter psychrotolerans]
MKRVLILDLDNTIYPVNSIANHLFGQLFKLIDEHLEPTDSEMVNKAKDELTRRPYQHVADEFGFSAELKAMGMEMLNNIELDVPMRAFEQYAQIQNIAIDKYLVTTGFTKLQMSKVKMLGIEADFKGIYIVDPEKSSQTKKDVFANIMAENGYTAKEVLVIGDDPKSEIKAAVELGIDTFLFDPGDRYTDATVTYRGKDYTDVVKIVRGS